MRSVGPAQLIDELEATREAEAVQDNERKKLLERILRDYYSRSTANMVRLHAEVEAVVSDSSASGPRGGPVSGWVPTFSKFINCRYWRGLVDPGC